jgi:hypothetical protein
MPSPVQINFQVGGVSEVRRAFGDVVSYLERMERNQTRLAQREATARQRVTEREAEQKKRTQTRFASATEFLQRQQVQQEQRGATERVRATERAARQMDSIHRRSATLSGQLATKEANDAIREANRAYRAKMQFARAIGGATASGVMAGGRRVAGLAGATMNLALGSGFGVAQSVQRSIAASGTAADIANSAWIPNGADQTARVKRNPADILAAARGVGIHAGMSQEDVLGGLQKFVGKTGRLDEGLKLMKDLAELARATGSSFEDVADAAGDVSNAFGGNNPDGVLSVARGLAEQGKIGAVEYRNLASQMAKLAAAAGQVGGDAAQNMLIMGMLAQGARAGGGAASATQAATSSMAMINTLKTPARVKQFRAHGIEVFGKDKMIRDPRQIILESLEKTGGDPMEMKKMWANVMGERAVTDYANIFRKAEAQKPGTGKGAALGEMNRLLGGAGMSQQQVNRAFGDRMQVEDAKIASAMAEFDKAIATELVPELMKLIPVVRETTPAFVTILRTGIPAFAELITTVARFTEKHKELLAWFASNAIPTIIGASLAQSILQAGIGQGVRTALMAMIGSGGAPALAGAGGTAGKIAGGLGLVGVVAGGAVLANSMYESQEAKETSANRSALATSTGGTNAAMNLLAKLRAGTVSAEDVGGAKATRQSLDVLRAQEEAAVKSPGWNPWSPILGRGQRQQNAEGELKNTVTALQQLQNAIEQSEAALRKHSSTSDDKWHPANPTRNGPISGYPRGGAQ